MSEVKPMTNDELTRYMGVLKMPTDKPSSLPDYRDASSRLPKFTPIDLSKELAKRPPVPDGLYNGSSGGYFVVKDNVAYWRSGAVWEKFSECVTCYLPVSNLETAPLEYRYDLLTDEERRKHLEERRIANETYQREEQERTHKLEQLVESARTKITEEEFDAILELHGDR